MNFNIYFDDETGEQLNQVAKQSGATRNSLVRQAVSDWLSRHGKPQWPEAVMSFNGLADIQPFEANRDKLIPPSSDPLA